MAQAPTTEGQRGGLLQVRETSNVKGVLGSGEGGNRTYGGGRAVLSPSVIAECLGLGPPRDMGAVLGGTVCTWSLEPASRCLMRSKAKILGL